MYITSRHIDTRTGAISTGNGGKITVFVRSGAQGPKGNDGAPAPFTAISPDGTVQGFIVGDTIVLELSNWDGRIRQLPTYADNAEAIAADAKVDQVYKTPTGDLKIVI